MVHPNARILNARNTSRGVEARSLILSYLEARGDATTREVAEGVSLGVRSAYFHLRRLAEARSVVRLSRRPARWEVTLLGQKRISAFLPA